MPGPDTLPCMPEANSPSSSSPHAGPAEGGSAHAARATGTGEPVPTTTTPRPATGPAPDSARQDAAHTGKTVHEAPPRQPSGPGDRPESHPAPSGSTAGPQPSNDADEHGRPPLTPRQARRIRIAVSTVVMLVVAAALAIRLRSAPSVLTVGFYGLALILSGTAIVLSRLGRTRVATAVLGLGFVLVLSGEWLLGFSGGP
ncbi:hypothetical protein SUDANB19_05642 [Streptomyces sp. enrichment culture]